MGVFVRDIKGLLESVSVDNRGAFERFYNLYYDQVFRFAYYCLGEKEACREVVTDVFFSVWQSRKRLKDIDNIDTYLYISVRNESFRFQARNKDLNRVSLNELLPLMEEEDEGSPEEHLELKEMREMLDKAIDELPEKCRLVFLMSREEGLKTKEILSEILSVQESTVRVQMKICYRKIGSPVEAELPKYFIPLLLMFIFNVIYNICLSFLYGDIPC